MKIVFKYYIMTMLVICLLIPVMTSAQNIDRARNQFQKEYWQTNQVINRAQNVIEEANRYRHLELVKIAIDASGKMLVQAKQLQEKAREQLNATNVTNIQIGNNQTTRARDWAWKSINIIKKASDKIVRQAEENENLVVRQLEKTDQLINRLRDEFKSENTGNRMASLFDSARENQRRAWELYRNGNVRPALKMSNQAEKSLRKIGELLKADNKAHNRLRNQLNQLEIQLMQAGESLQACDSDEAVALMERAQHAYQEACNFTAQNQPKPAEQAIKNARKFMRKAAGLCSDQNLLENRIRRMTREMEQLTKEIGPNSSPAMRRLMEEAREHLRKATRLCENGNKEACAANIKAAQININKAKRIAGM